MEQTGTSLKLAWTRVYRQKMQGAPAISRLGRSLLLLVCASTVALAQTGQQPGIRSITSAANAAAGLAPESLGTAIGTDLAAGTASSQSVPWPTTLGGITVQVTDSASTPVTRLAGLVFVSPSQINFQVPAGTVPGPATVTINNGQQAISAQVQIGSVAPGLFSVNAQGDAAATGIRVAKPTDQQSHRCSILCGPWRRLPSGAYRFGRRYPRLLVVLRYRAPRAFIARKRGGHDREHDDAGDHAGDIRGSAAANPGARPTEYPAPTDATWSWRCERDGLRRWSGIESCSHSGDVIRGGDIGLGSSHCPWILASATSFIPGEIS